MEVSRSSRKVKNKIIVGDCISVDRSYFGVQYGHQLPQHIDKINGRVVSVFENCSSRVVWDIDKTESTVKNECVNVESKNTPMQTLSTEDDVITEEDFHGAIIIKTKCLHARQFLLLKTAVHKKR